MTNILKKLYSVLRPFLEPGTAPLLFVVGLILLNMISNALYELLKNQFDTPIRILLIAAGVLVLSLIIYALFRRFFKQELRVKDLAPRRGLIVLVSQGKLHEIPAYSSLEFHKPALTHCWLITSRRPLNEPDQPPTSSGEAIQSAWKNAQDLKGQLQENLKVVNIIEIDPENPKEIFDEADKIFRAARRAGLRSNEIVADFTGGTKTMSISLVLACIPSGRAVEYMKPRKFLPDGRADSKAGSDPKLVDLGLLLRELRSESEE